MKYSNTTMIVSACDVNAFVWPYWYEYFKRNWDFTCGIDVVFLCENKRPLFPHIKYECGEGGWTKRVNRFLYAHDEIKHIIYFVEDQLLMGAVDVRKIKELVILMDKTKIFYISLFDNKYSHRHVTRNIRKDFPNLINMSYDQYYVWVMQPHLSNAEFFRSMLFDDDSIWQTEIKGQDRVRARGIKTYMYVDSPVIPFREVCRQGKIKVHRQKYLWAVDAGEMFPKGDEHLDKFSTAYYYRRWKDKIKLPLVDTDMWFDKPDEVER